MPEAAHLSQLRTKIFLFFFLFYTSVAGAAGPVQITIIVMQNRSTDNLFGCMPGVVNTSYGFATTNCATAAPTAPCQIGHSHGCSGSSGQGTFTLAHANPALPDCSNYDCPHNRDAWVNSYDAGAMDGFGGTCSNNSAVQCYYNNNSCTGYCQMEGYSYFLPSDLLVYGALCKQFACLVNLFSGIAGPSSPNMLFVAAAQSNEAVDIPVNINNNVGGGNPENWRCDDAIIGGTQPTCSGSSCSSGGYVYAGNTLSRALAAETLFTVSVSAGDYYTGGACSDNATPCICDTGSSDANPGSCTANTGGNTACTGIGTGACNTTNISIGGKKGGECPDVMTYADEFDSNSVTWRVYSPDNTNKAAHWNWFAYVAHKFFGTENSMGLNGMAHCSSPPSSSCYVSVAPDAGPLFDADAASGHLPQVAWLLPPWPATDHPPNPLNNGQAWMAQRINAYAKSSYWATGMLIVVWDDWGGFYDHVAPTAIDQNGPGFRVPGLVISPYAIPGVNTTLLDFGSIGRCLENTFISTSTYLTARDQNATSICGSGVVNLALNTPPPAFIVPSMSLPNMIAEKKEDPDLVTIVASLFRRRHEAAHPKLATRSCPEGTEPGQARKNGNTIEICHTPGPPRVGEAVFRRGEITPFGEDEGAGKD